MWPKRSRVLVSRREQIRRQKSLQFMEFMTKPEILPYIETGVCRQNRPEFPVWNVVGEVCANGFPNCCRL